MKENQDEFLPILNSSRGVKFTRADADLFLNSDARLRGDALQADILPRLHGVFQDALALIHSIYEVEPLDRSLVSFWPNFRKNRERPLKHLYESCFVGLGGRRNRELWTGFERDSGETCQTVPFRLGLVLTQEGLEIELHHDWVGDSVTAASRSKLTGFYLRHSGLVQTILSDCGMRFDVNSDNDGDYFAPFEDHLRRLRRNGVYPPNFYSNALPLPVSDENLEAIIIDYAFMFPIYDGLIRAASGQKDRFESLIAKANSWVRRYQDQHSDREEESPLGHRRRSLREERASLRAERKVQVAVGIRFRVFQRDDFCCVLCGARGGPNTLLHLDHILPRSKGGSDDIENLQTLCSKCNLGKSNRDQTDLRRKRAA